MVSPGSKADNGAAADEVTVNVEEKLLEEEEELEEEEDTMDVGEGDSTKVPDAAKGEKEELAELKAKRPGWPEYSVFRVVVPVLKVLVFGKEETDEALPPAIDAMIRVFKRVNGLFENDGDDITHGSNGVGFCSIRLLVASTQAISLIGKQGSVIKSSGKFGCYCPVAL